MTIHSNDTRQLFPPHFHERDERCLTYKAVRRLPTNKQRNGLWAARCDPSKTAAQRSHPSWCFLVVQGILTRARALMQRHHCNREKTFFCNEGAVVAYSEQPNWPHLLLLMCLCRVKLVVQGCESVGLWESISAPLQSAIRVISLTFFMATAVAIMMLADYAVIG